MARFQNSLNILLCLIGMYSFGQQITVDDTLSPETLIQEHLISGCVEATNITSPVNGSINNLVSYGFFERAGSNFPFENGIVLSSGDVSRVGNGLDNGIITSGEDSWGTDPAIEAALGIGSTLNATTLQFNFSSISDRVEFNYILASEEYYANFPCAFSDGFAFLIRRAGTNDPYENIALVPNTNIPVNTTTIRPDIDGFCSGQNEEYFAGFNMGDTNFNGRTEVLTAVANIIPYEIYEIKLIVADQNDKNYDTAVFIQGDSFGSKIDLGPDIETCASEYELNGELNNPDAVYTWFLNDDEISGANSSEYTATESGLYRVEATIAINSTNCVISDEMNLIVESSQTSEPLTDYILCDINNNGIQNFNLDSKIDEILNAVPNSDYTISFHLSQGEAENDNNPISGSINNSLNPQVIYTRIEDISSGCVLYSNFNLVVSELPELVAPTPLVVCAPSELNGQSTIDFSSKIEEITNNNSDLLVSFHASINGAINNSEILVNPYVNTNRNETVFVRVENENSGCFNTVPLQLEVIDMPDINTDTTLYLDACDQDYNGDAVFDLNSIISTAVSNTVGIDISFYESFEDAELYQNPISNPGNYNNSEANVQIIYIRVDAQDSDCFNIAPIELHTNLLLTGTNLSDVNACDEDGNGTEQFYFNAIAETIFNEIPDLSIDFYLTAEDRDNDTNALNPNEVFINTTNPQIIYVTISSPTCSEQSQIELNVNEIVEFESVETLYVCDEDQDEITTIDLSLFDEEVTFGDSDFSVSYFLTEEAAANNENPLPRFYENTSNPLVLYPRITSDISGCSSFNSFQVIVRPAPITNNLEELVICDIDRDGFYEIDLNSYINQVVDNQQDRTISFHNSLEDAETSSNAILDLSNYNAQTEVIYIRVANTVTGCPSIEELNIIVNTLPEIGDNGLVNQFLICENASDGIAEFIFSDWDQEIIGEQLGKETSYYLNPTDAENRANQLNKNEAFLNATNPQTIYVRLENTTDISCYQTGSFEIYVSTNPEFNIPTNEIVCDDISNDGSEPIDLGSKTIEITQGHDDIIDVTYYLSENDAINEENPLSEDFQNITNPQQIYVSIDNGTECKSITSFAFTVIQAPEVSIPNPLASCDSNFDGTEIFNLTESEFDIFDIRQDNITVAYFTTSEEAFDDVNPISSPEAYSHSSNSEGVYIRVTNTVSNCFVVLPLELQIITPPIINDFGSFAVCVNDEQIVDLSTVTSVAIDNAESLEISYHLNENEAQTGNNPLDDIYTYTSASDYLYIRALDINSGCLNTYGFRLEVYDLPISNMPMDLEFCDDNYDGQLLIDLSQQDQSILGNQNSNSLSVSYYNSLEEAEFGTNPIDSNYLASDGEELFARTTNAATSCWSTTSFYVYINPLPILDIGNQVVCIDNLPLFVSAETGVDTDTYLWSNGSTASEIEITEIGEYSVTITTNNGCSATEVFSVSESESATVEFTEVLDFSDPNNITITVSGIGDYLYILDDGEAQESNIFENVTLGYHVITIIDLNGCSPITKEVLVIDAPKFFTPNNDGFHDTWHITGVETLPGTEIYIYDRYGKLLTKIGWDTPGWDGTFNGANLAANDYWFKAFVKRDQIEFEVTGHFALRR